MQKIYAYLMAVFWFFMSYYSYNPYTYSVIMRGYSSVKLSLNKILSFGDGSSTTLMKKDGKWECTGAYADKRRCGIIVSVQSGQYDVFRDIEK